MSAIPMFFVAMALIVSAAYSAVILTASGQSLTEIRRQHIALDYRIPAAVSLSSTTNGYCS
jgi:hypothetical protein